MEYGPFDVTSTQILGLQTRFTAFVNKLLKAEYAHHEIAGHHLVITSNDDAADGGVDAYLGAVPPGSNWIPEGSSAIQFKRGDLSAAQCAKELDKSSAALARSILGDGGSYVLLIGGRDLPHESLKERAEAIREVALRHGLIADDDSHRIRVYAAEQLARWSSEFPALAVDDLIGGPRHGAVAHSRWRASPHQQFRFVVDDTRLAVIEDLRARLKTRQLREVRLQGEPGIGKTRLAMEVLEDEKLSPLVAYIASAAEITAGLVESILAAGRCVILVIDECPAERHISFVGRLTDDPRMMLITIGDVGAARSAGPALKVTPLGANDMTKLLTGDFPALWPEAQRFVTDYSLGNPGMAIWLAQTVLSSNKHDAADLIERDDIITFITRYLPEGADFFSVAVLALFERVGWDRELQEQKVLLADFLGVSSQELDRLVHDLSTRGLAKKQGRYRAIDPLPLAVYLAGEAWKALGPRVVTELMPRLPEDLAIAFYRRLADLGRFGPATETVGQLLASSGPFGSLERIEADDSHAALTPLAIVLPDEMARHLSILVEQASLAELRSQTRMRRNLVWTLEKLVWHTRTFELAAKTLLRLALAENESWANNATGTWLDLFGSRLPATAALPAQRLDHLERVARSPIPELRLLAARAASRGLQEYETVDVSGEVQGGVLVEPRGGVTNWDEDAEYRNQMVLLLSGLANDPVEDVAAAASRTLLGTLHGSLADPRVGPTLTEALLNLPKSYNRALRIEIERILGLLGQPRSNPNADNEALISAVQTLKGRIPKPSPEESLATLLRARGYSVERNRVRDEMSELVARLTDEQIVRVIVELEDNTPAAFELGEVVAAAGRDSSGVISAFERQYQTCPGGLLGVLHARATNGDEDAFDRYLESSSGSMLHQEARLSIAARGPTTPAAVRRVIELSSALDIPSAAAAIHVFRPPDATSYLSEILSNWLTRIGSQSDYDAAVNWASVALTDGSIDPDVASLLWRLIETRLAYPDLGHAAWEWSQLAMRLTGSDGLRTVTLLLNLMSGDLAYFHASSEEVQLFITAAKADPKSAWTQIGERLEGPAPWRFIMQLHDWVQSAIPTMIIVDWIGESVERARLVAELTHPGAAAPSDLARHLLDRFPGDEQIDASLRARLFSGIWTGPWSSRVESQITQLSDWDSQEGLELPVRAWAHEVVLGLKAELVRVREFEAERGY